MSPDRLPEFRARYLRDAHPVRLGNLASSLARVASFSMWESREDATVHALQECLLFIEWGGPEWELDLVTPLAELQSRLMEWRQRWLTQERDAKLRAELSSFAREASDQALQWTGLLDEEPAAA